MSKYFTQKLMYTAHGKLFLREVYVERGTGQELASHGWERGRGRLLS